MMRFATPSLLVILALFTSCGREKDVPCRELVVTDKGVSFGPRPVDWGLLGQQIQLEFDANELPTCREGKTTRALVTVTDPLNDELPNTFEVNAPEEDFARVVVQFQPVRVGLHHIIVRFLPIGGTSQRDVLIVEPVRGTPQVLPYYCGEVFRLPGGTLICDEKVLHPDGTLAESLDESMARSTFGGELWAMRSQTVAHYVEVDAGQLQLLQSRSFTNPPGWTKVMGGPNEAIAVNDSALTALTPDGGGLSLSPTVQSVLAPNIETALRVGELVYLVSPFGLDHLMGRYTLCGYRKLGTSFVAEGGCEDLGTPVVGAGPGGFWTFSSGGPVSDVIDLDAGVFVRASSPGLVFVVPSSDGGLTERASSLHLPSSFGVLGSVSRLGADQLPILVSSEARFVPARVDGGIELRSLPAPQYSNAGANSTAIWWAVGNTTTVYPAP